MSNNRVIAALVSSADRSLLTKGGGCYIDAPGSTLDLLGTDDVLTLDKARAALTGL